VVRVRSPIIHHITEDTVSSLSFFIELFVARFHKNSQGQLAIALIPELLELFV
jgi:hypothetical protein